MDNFNVYKDIKARTNGEIYIGVVGHIYQTVYGSFGASEHCGCQSQGTGKG